MYLSDSLTIGLIFGILLFAVALYLYTAISQTEQKVSLLESILLDLKISNELQSYSDGGVVKKVDAPANSSEENTYEAFKEEESKLEEEEEEDLSESAEFLPLNVASSALPVKPLSPVPEVPTVVELSDVVDSTEESPVNYDTMSLKELQALAKSKGFTGSMKKAALLEALKSTSQQPSLWPSSLAENSAPFSNE